MASRALPQGKGLYPLGPDTEHFRNRVVTETQQPPPERKEKNSVPLSARGEGLGTQDPVMQWEALSIVEKSIAAVKTIQLA